MYVAVKGGEKAIAAAHALLARERRGDVQIPEVTLEQLAGQLKLVVDRIMAEGSLYSPELAALAFKQAQGDAVEAIFLLRAYRTTLPRFGVSEPMDTSRMRVERRISATWKDLPGGQILGSTFDYTHRLLDRGLAVPGTAPRDVEPERTAEDLAMMAADAQALLQEPLPRAMNALGREGLMEFVAPSHEGNDCPDITRQPLELPADGSGDRAVRLQSMARADEGFLLGMAYSTQRGYGAVHPFTGELRRGFVELTVIPEKLGFAITLAKWSSPNATWSAGTPAVPSSPASPAVTGSSSATTSARPCPCPSWTAPCVPGNCRKTRSVLPRTPNSCSCMGITWMRPVSCSTSNCRTMWTFRRNFP